MSDESSSTKDLKFEFRFPAYAMANDIVEEVNQTWDEAEEAVVAFEEGESYERVVEELMDTIHAAESALRLFANEVDLDKAYAGVIEKNRARGYYEIS